MFDNSLADEIEAASEAAFSELFSVHPGKYYYCSLVTTGEALPPVISAWSSEALRTEMAATGLSEDMLKWSCVDSPYYAFGENHFSVVRELFSDRVVGPEAEFEEWTDEYDVRMESMVEAMKRLDRKGLFGHGKARENVVLLVEVIPPDETNTDRARDLNALAAIKEWLAEAAE
ncbi:MAG: DUF4303 domain-containing protein [Planctomycetes bacterium]|nr:DUF4303 domain-containing protein [Planctomycetota bacterium]